MPGQGRRGKSDAFQRKARREGYRARSAYKLKDIQRKSKATTQELQSKHEGNTKEI